MISAGYQLGYEGMAEVNLANYRLTSRPHPVFLARVADLSGDIA